MKWSCSAKLISKWAYVTAVAFLIVLANALTLYLLRINPAKQRFNTLLARSQLILFALSLYTYLKASFTAPGSVAQWPKERPDLQHPNLPAPPSAPVPVPDTDVEAGLLAERVEDGNIDGNSDDNKGSSKDDEHSTTSSPSQSPSRKEQPTEKERYCKICKHHKPRRVHHCGECDICVLRFDHHCPWVGNCIGLYNSKYFALFLFYTTALSLHTSCITLNFLYLLYGGGSGSGSHWKYIKMDSSVIISVAIIAPIVLLIALPSTCMVGLMLWWTVWLASRNETTLESIKLEEEIEKIERFHIANNLKFDIREIEKEREKQRPYGNHNVLSNLRHLYGWNVLLWLIPIQQSRLCPYPQSMSLAKR